MAGKCDVCYGNVGNTMLLQFVASFGAAAINTTTQYTVTVPGLLVGDQISTVSKLTYQAGLLLYGFVTAPNTLTVVAANITGAAITPTAGDTYVIEVNRQSALGQPLPMAFN